MKHITKPLLLLLLPAALTFQACDKEIADTTAATDEKNVAADTSQSMVSILAGTTFGYKDGPALQAQFSLIADIAVADDGAVYVAEATRIRKLKDGTVSTVAGSATSGCKDGPGKSALFGKLSGIDVAADGSIYVVDAGNNSIRKITTKGTVSTFAGGADKKGYQDGPLKTARFTDLFSIAIGTEGIIYIRELSNLRKIDSSGTISTIFKGETNPDPGTHRDYVGAITTSPDGTLFYTNTSGGGFPDWSIGSIPRMPETFPDGVAAGLGNGPADIAAENGKIYILYRDFSFIGTPNYPINYDDVTIVAGIFSVDEPRPTEPEEGPALEVYFTNLTALAWHDNTLYAVDGVKIKKVTLP